MRIQRIFIDEITAVNQWERALKRVLDSGELDSVLIITTGSNAADLRRGVERLPGRKGKLQRTSYIFTPVSFSEFKRVCGDTLGNNTIKSYLLSGGSPVACAELASSGRIPEYVREIIKNRIYGECVATGRQRSSLLSVMQILLRFGGNATGQAKVAREAGLANNSVAAGYIELLFDLLCVGTSYAWDASKDICLRRMPAKYHLLNLLAGIAFDSANIRTVNDFNMLSPEIQGKWLEWLVAQEIWRRAALKGNEFPEDMKHWKSKDHELDFVIDRNLFLEVKRGKTSPIEFLWLVKTFPHARLLVVSSERFATEKIRSITLEDFLSNENLNEL